MALIARYLLHTSASARMHHDVVAEQVRPLMAAGVIATCATLDAEALYSAAITQSMPRFAFVAGTPTSTSRSRTDTGRPP
ncbi:hypothetical protein BJY21_004054 [Kineosphaera limosa]|nr:hypothetical protein [Kineosphaera limosa]